MIAIINTGGANIASITNALDRQECQWTLTQDAELIKKADKVILPGVGAAKDCMRNIEQAGLVELIRSLKQPVLGICLGMQIMYEYSEEGDTQTLGLIPGKVKQIPKFEGLSLPHMGWNQLQWKDKTNPLALDLDEPTWVYFVHSFYAEANEFSIASCEYGIQLTAAVNKDNFWGCQFHPERSAGAGATILKNFLRL